MRPTNIIYVAVLCGILFLFTPCVIAQQKVDVNARDRDGRTVLMNAAMFGHAEEVNKLLSKGADVNIADSEGMTALMWAVMGGKVVVVKTLIEAGADITAKDKKGHTAQYYAESIGNRPVAQLINSAANRSVKEAEKPATPGDPRFLPAPATPSGKPSNSSGNPVSGTDSTASGSSGYEPITPRVLNGIVDTATSVPPPVLPFTAVAAAPVLAVAPLVTLPLDIFGSIVSGLLGGSKGGTGSSRGAAGGGQVRDSVMLDIDSSNTTSLMNATILGHLDEVNKLIAKGTDLNTTDAEGRTALMWAAMGGNVEIVKALLDAGANPGIVDNKGYTAVIYADLAGNKGIVTLINSATATSKSVEH